MQAENGCYNQGEAGYAIAHVAVTSLEVGESPKIEKGARKSESQRVGSNVLGTIFPLQVPDATISHPHIKRKEAQKGLEFLRNIPLCVGEGGEGSFPSKYILNPKITSYSTEMP